MATNGDDMNERLVRVESKVDGLSDKFDIQFEKVREDIQKLGEGYEQGLKAISRQISDLDRRWAAKWSPHDLAIKDHGKRITALEQRRK